LNIIQDIKILLLKRKLEGYGCSSVVEYMLSICKTLDSSPAPPKKKSEKEQKSNSKMSPEI
jgi:hypothetical protein